MSSLSLVILIIWNFGQLEVYKGNTYRPLIFSLPSLCHAIYQTVTADRKISVSAKLNSPQIAWHTYMVVEYTIQPGSLHVFRLGFWKRWLGAALWIWHAPTKLLSCSSFLDNNQSSTRSNAIVLDLHNSYSLNWWLWWTSTKVANWDQPKFGEHDQ